MVGRRRVAFSHGCRRLETANPRRVAGTGRSTAERPSPPFAEQPPRNHNRRSHCRCGRGAFPPENPRWSHVRSVENSPVGQPALVLAGRVAADDRRAAAARRGPGREPAGTSENRNRGTVQIVFSGDVMLDAGPGHAIAHGEDPFAELAPILQGADIAVCNLECVVARHGYGTHVLKPYTFKARPECIPVLARYFSAVGVANNHSGDYGPDGLLEELTQLEKGRLPYFGGGRDRKEAYRPLILERNGRRVALLGYDGFPPRSFEAGDHRPGVAWLTPEAAVAGIKAARAEFHADLVIPNAALGPRDPCGARAVAENPRPQLDRRRRRRGHRCPSPRYANRRRL